MRKQTDLGNKGMPPLSNDSMDAPEIVRNNWESRERGEYAGIRTEMPGDDLKGGSGAA